MKKFSTLSNQSLHDRTLAAAAGEKSATLVLLEHLAEVDRRKVYATMGYSSLWLYVNQALGYSETQASERVSATRLMVRVPEVKEDLAANRVSLTTVAKLATHVRREKTPRAETLGLLDAIVGKSSREVERVLAAESTVDVFRDQVKVITPETARITIDVDGEFLELMNRVRELKGHPGSSTQELLLVAMKELVKRDEQKKEKGLRQKERAAEEQPSALVAPELPAQEVLLAPPSVSEPPVRTANSRYIPANIRTKIRLRSGDQCEYVDPHTKHRCDCKTKLQFDHIIPYVLGGETTFENLRHYCTTHNQLSALRYFGHDHMDPFLKN